MTYSPEGASCYICEQMFYVDETQKLLCLDCLQTLSLDKFDHKAKLRHGVATINTVFAREELEAHLLAYEKQLVSSAIPLHQQTLRRTFRQALRFNDFGGIDKDERPKVTSQFLEASEIVLEVLSLEEATELISTQLEHDKEEHASLDNLPSDGLEFEHWVAENLNSFGWSARVTQGSGDQGVDVLASKEGKTVAIQCKLYSSPVGNKAVQEAFSGAKFYDAQYAAVLTNAGFTSSAKDLAASTGVMLLSPEDIPTFSP